MKLIKKHPRIFLFVLICLFTIVVLEIVFRRCEFYYYSHLVKIPSCEYLVDTYVEEKVDHKPQFSTYQEYLESGYIYYINSNELKANGLACNPYAFIADDLPKAAKKYVVLHEAFHIIGVESETKANYKAAIIEPMGMIQTVYISLTRNFSLEYLPCKIAISWRLFKMYFLGF